MKSGIVLFVLIVGAATVLAGCGSSDSSSSNSNVCDGKKVCLKSGTS